MPTVVIYQGWLNNMDILKLFIFAVFHLPRITFITEFGTVPVEAYSNNIYTPLKIFPYFKNLRYELNVEEGQLLKTTVNNVIIYIKKILSVIPTPGNLLLERNACRTSWIDGRNKGKCATIRKDYIGEFCMDNFIIPDEHLEAFYTWSNKPLPDKTWFTDGVGVYYFDYILYIQATTSQSCLKSLMPGASDNFLIAYASYCKLGKDDRPVAGYINFCPSEFIKYKHDKNKLILVTLHEIFHALGFSKDLFLKFRDIAQPGLNDNLPHYSYPVLRNLNGVYSLMTPSVISKMTQQFGCPFTTHDVGAPLVQRNGILQSHWNRNVFPGSIMVSQLGEPEYTFVDPITLAVFQDTGWYSVNFSNGDDYLWGKDKGCDFLKEITHHADSFDLCPESYVTGCNFWQTEVIKCKHRNISTSEYQQDTVRDCRLEGNNRFNSQRSQDVGKCILYQSNFNTVGRCVIARCSLGHAWIKLEPSDTNWIKCPFGEKVDDLENRGIITCPKHEDVFCYTRQMPIYLQDLVKLETTTVNDLPQLYTRPITQRNFYVINNGSEDQLPASASYVQMHLTHFALFVVVFIIIVAEPRL